jgi:hypothetical protein
MKRLVLGILLVAIWVGSVGAQDDTLWVVCYKNLGGFGSFSANDSRGYPISGSLNIDTGCRQCLDAAIPANPNFELPDEVCAKFGMRGQPLLSPTGAKAWYQQNCNRCR